MRTLRSLLARINVNYALFACAAVLVLYALTSPVVADPLLNFLFAGIVPGTGTVLSPSTMLLGVAVALGIFVGALAIYGLVKGLRRRKLRIRYIPVASFSEQVPTAAAADTPEEVIIFDRESITEPAAPQPRKSRRPLSEWAAPIGRRTGRVVLALDGALTLAVLRTLRAVRRAARRLSGAIAAAADALVSATKLLVRLCSRLVRAVAAGAAAAAAAAVVLAKEGWRRAVPHLERLDTWLELRYRSLARRVSKLLQRSETVRIASQAVRSGRSNLRKQSK